MVLSGSYGYYNESYDGGYADLTPTNYSDCTSFMEAALVQMESTQKNWENFNKAIALQEMDYLSAHGVDMVYEAEEKKNLLNSIMETIKKWGRNLLGVIEKFKDQVSGVINNARAWVGVNKKKALAPNAVFASSRKFKDYDLKTAGKIMDLKLIFQDDAIDLYADENIKNAKAVGEKTAIVKQKIEDAKKEWHVEGDITTANIKKAFIGDEKSKIDIDGSYMSAKEAIDEITNFKTGIDGIKAAQKGVKSATNNMLKSVKKLGDVVDKNAKSDNAKNEGAKAIHEASAAVTDAAKANNALVNAQLSVYWMFLHQCKKIAGIYASSVGRVEKQNESSLMSRYGFELA